MFKSSSKCSILREQNSITPSWLMLKKEQHTCMCVLWSASHAIVIRFVYFHAVTIVDTRCYYYIWKEKKRPAQKQISLHAAIKGAARGVQQRNEQLRPSMMKTPHRVLTAKALIFLILEYFRRPEAVDELPNLFFDAEIYWHRAKV